MKDAIVAAAALSLTGRFSVQGEQARRGLMLWAAHVNRAGGLIVSSSDNPRPIELRIHDDASRRAGAAATTERLIQGDKADLLFSPYSSMLTIAAAEVAARHGRVLWNHGGSSDALERRGWHRVVTLLSPASRYFEPVLEMAVVRAAAAGRPSPTVAILHGAAGTFSQAVADGAEQAASRLGLEMVFRAPYPTPSSLAGQTPGLPFSPARERESASRGDRVISLWAGQEPLAALVARLAAIRPDLVLGVGTTEADLAFARELRCQELTTPTVALVAAPIEHFRDELGPAADGFCGPSQWEPTLSVRPDIGPTSADFAASYRAHFGVEPDYPAAQAYAAGLIAAECVRQARCLEDGALRQVAGHLDLTTFYGRFRLDQATGQQIGHRIVVVQWQAGRKQIVWPQSVATAAPQLPAFAATPTPSPSDDDPS